MLTKRGVRIGAALLAVALLGSAGCAPENPRKSSGGAGGANGRTVNIGLLGIMSDAPIAIAMERGYFKKNDVSLKIQNFASGGAMVAPMASQQLDVGGGAFSAGMVNAVANGNPLVIVADKGSFPSPELGSQQFVVRKDLAGQIKEMSDLAGRKIAVGTAVGTAPYSGVVGALSDAGVKDPQSLITSMKSSDVAVALEQGAADAAWLSEPNAALAIEKGYAVPWKTAYDVAPREQDATIFYNSSWAKRNADLAQSFMNAYVCGVDDYLTALDAGGTQRDDVLRIIAEYTSTDVKTIEKARPPGFFKGAVPDVESVEHIVDSFRDLGQVDRTVPMDRLIDMKYIKAAAKADCG